MISDAPTDTVKITYDPPNIHDINPNSNCIVFWLLEFKDQFLKSLGS
jgi:hypothetical protein